MSAMPWWLRRTAVVVAEPRQAPVLVYRMGLLAATFDRAVDTPDDALPVPLLDQKGVRALGLIEDVGRQYDCA